MHGERMSLFDTYYINQAGGGGDRMSNFYRGGIYQKGNGLGAILSSVFRAVLPLVKSGAKYIGKEALTTGLDIINDQEASGDSYEKVIKRQMSEAGKRVIKKMRGSGVGRKKKKTTIKKNGKCNSLRGGGRVGGKKKYNKRQKQKSKQSRSGKDKRKKVSKQRDIFS